MNPWKPEEHTVSTPQRLVPLLAAALACPIVAQATNGMNLEAYGAKAGGMGGASFAYDSGNSAVMNNPATLGLKPDGRSDLGLGLTLLQPDVASRRAGAGEAASGGDAYWMPSISWVHRSGAWTYGAGLLAQGGMGTEYGTGSRLFATGTSMGGMTAALSGEEQRSEVGVGRLMFPLGYRVSDALSVAAQLDLVWATMDVKMDIDGRHFGRMLAGTPGIGSVSGSLVGAFAALPAGTDVNFARFDFSDTNDFNGKARGHGFAGKLGFVYRLHDDLSLGGTWHGKTAISDLEAQGATVKMGLSSGTLPMTGKITVINFQWPETYGLGLAWNATPQLMLAADLKHIGWARAMKDFSLRFEADGGNPAPFANQSMTATMEQNWRNQTVLMLGGQYMVRPDLALRLGFNRASNPVPDGTLHPLFPAIVEKHYTVGLGWRIGGGHSLAASLAYAPEVKQTNTLTDPGIASSHSQLTWRVNYNLSY
jgi:long-chain fatty acid transport protein